MKAAGSGNEQSTSRSPPKLFTANERKWGGERPWPSAFKSMPQWPIPTNPFLPILGWQGDEKLTVSSKILLGREKSS